MVICEMAAVSDCFSIGSIVACTTCFHKTIEGEVLAFDPLTKMLILKCPSSDAVKTLNDVYIVNLSMCGDVRVIKECSTIPEPPQSLNLQRLGTRVRNAIDQKKRLVSALAAGVSPEGQKLYMAISKTINNEVTWNGANIVVFTDVTITPPYRVENVGGSPDSRQLAYVRKIVEKFVRDQQVAAAAAAAAAASAASAAAVAAAAAATSAAAAAPSSSTATAAATNPGGNNSGGAAGGGAAAVAAGGGGSSSSTTTSPTSSSSGASSSSSSTAPSPVVVVVNSAAAAAAVAAAAVASATTVVTAAAAAGATAGGGGAGSTTTQQQQQQTVAATVTAN